MSKRSLAGLLVCLSGAAGVLGHQPGAFSGAVCETGISIYFRYP